MPDDSAEEAETLRAGGKAAGGADFGQSGAGVGLRTRCGGVWPHDPSAERGRCVHAGMFVLGSRHQLRQPQGDASVGSDCGRARVTTRDSLRQRARTNQSALSGVVRGAEDRAAAHPAREADAERAHRKLPRTVAGRMPGGPLPALHGQATTRKVQQAITCGL